MNVAIPAAMHSNHSFIGWLRAMRTSGARQTKPTTSARTWVREIARNDIVEVTQPLYVAIECLKGSVWVTLDGDSRDVVLDAGQTFVVDRNQRTLLQALEAARVRFVKPPCAPLQKGL
jgi:hypothetical protein